MATPRRYWCNTGLVVKVDGPEGSFVHLVDKPFARLGDGPGCETALPRDAAAEQGLYLHATESGVFAVELPRSTAKKRSAAQWLQPDEPFALGECRVSAQLTAEPRNGKTLPDLRVRGAIREPRPLLVVSVDGEEVASCRLHRRLTVLGSHAASNVRLRSESVAPSQLAFFWDAGALWAIDLTGDDRALWRGRAFDAVRLAPGDSILLGDVRVALAGSAGPRVNGVSNGVRSKANGNGHGNSQGSSWNTSASEATPGKMLEGDLTSEGGSLLVVAEPEPALETTEDAVPAPREARPTLPPPEEEGTEEFHEDADALFDRVTDRMVEIEHQAGRTRRVVRIVLALLSVVAALGGSLAAFHFAGPLLRDWLF